MKLGENLEIALSVNDLETSLAFYKQLGYSQFSDPFAEPHPWLVLSDGDIHLGLHQYEQPSPALVYFSNQFKQVVDYLRRRDIPLIDKMEMEGQLISVAFRDPNGQHIGVVDLMGAQIPVPPIEHSTHMGKFGEFSIPTRDLQVSLEFWRQFGFEASEYSDPYPWGILRDGVITIGLHQSTEPDFNESTITYFDPAMHKRVHDLQDRGIALWFGESDEDGSIRNAGIRSPDGQRFYLFEGEI